MQRLQWLAAVLLLSALPDDSNSCFEVDPAVGTGSAQDTLPAHETRTQALASSLSSTQVIGYFFCHLEFHGQSPHHAFQLSDAFIPFVSPGIRLKYLR